VDTVINVKIKILRAHAQTATSIDLVAVVAYIVVALVVNHA